MVEIPTVDYVSRQAVEAEIISRRAEFALGFNRFVLAGVSIALAFIAAIWLLKPQFTQFLLLGIAMVPLVICAIALPGLHRQGRTRLAVYLLITSIVLLLSVAPVIFSELLSFTGMGFIVMAAVAYLLLGNQDSRWLIGTMVFVFIADIFLTNSWTHDLFQSQLDETTSIIVLLSMNTLVLTVGILVVRMIVLGQENLFRQTQLANLEIEERAAAEREAKTQLENTVSEYMAFVEQVKDGDLTSRLELLTNGSTSGEVDDLYMLGTNLNVMVESLAEMAAQVREAATAVASAATEIQAAASQQVATAAEQDASVSETVATVEEVRVAVVQTAERAQAVADFSQQSVDVSRAGKEAVASSIEGMKLIQQRVESIAETILMLSERTQQIGEIIDTVNALADQSKLLALNASIEAARAGEEGKGFAVVAMEVRQLAEQSREATSRVREILGDIQKATNTAVMVTEEGSKGADAGRELVERAGSAIQELAGTLEDAAQAAMQIAASTHQQTNGMDQLATAMMQIKQASTQTAAGMKQTEQSIRDLMEMARQLEQAAGRYELMAG